MNKAAKAWTAAGIAATLLVTVATQVTVMYAKAGIIDQNSQFVTVAKEVNKRINSVWLPIGVTFSGLGGVARYLWIRRKGRSATNG